MIELGPGFRAATLAELMGGSHGRTMIERRSAGHVGAQRTISRRLMTVADLNARLAALEDRLRLEPGELVG